MVGRRVLATIRKNPLALLVVTVGGFVATAVRAILAGVLPLGHWLVPPVLAAGTLSLGVALIRSDGVRSALGAIPGVRESLRTLFRWTVGVTAGYWYSLAVAVAAFLLLDTPVRWGVYLTGNGPIGLATQYYVPGLVVGVGTLATSYVVVPRAVRTALTDGVRSVPRGVLESLWNDSRRTGVDLLVGLAFGTVVVVAHITVLEGIRAAFVGGAAGAVLVSLGLVVGSAIAVVLSLAATGRAKETSATRRLDRRGRRTVLVVTVVVLAATVGAAAVRATETRPVSTANEPLPEDPTAAYQTAHQNTFQGSFTVTREDLAGRNEGIQLVSTTAVERASRQVAIRYNFSGEQRDRRGYYDAGTDAPLFITPWQWMDGLEKYLYVGTGPGYWRIDAHRTEPGHVLGTPATEYTVENESDERLVLRRKGPLDRSVDVENVQREHLLVRIDKDTRTIRSIRHVVTARINGSAETMTNFRWRIRPEATVERPPELTHADPRVWAWRILTY